MRKICFLIGNLNFSGGTERVCSIIANGLSNAGHEVIIISIAGGDKPFFSLNKNIKIRSLSPSIGRALYRTPAIIYKLRKQLQKDKIDTLIVVETMAVLFTLPATYGLFIKHICWEHFNFNSDLGKKSRYYARHLAARFCDTVVTLTERDRGYWLNATKHRAQIVSIPNPSPFIPQKNKNYMGSKIVLAVGRLTYQKGFDLLLEAWAQVIKEAPDWKLLIVGKGEERIALQNFIDNNQLNNNVKLIGNTNKIEKYYEQAEIFCLSSRFEGFPMVLLETLSFGLPVVSFDCDTGPEEILQDTGSILVPINDTNHLADSLITLIKDSQRRKEISEKSIEKSTLYSSKVIVNEWLKLLNS